MYAEVPAHIKSPKILACVLCQQRKIKCDKGAPCSNCEKIGARCTPSTPAPARKKRRTNRDLRERLAKCEALLKQYGPLPTTNGADTSGSSPSVDYAGSGDGSLLQSPLQIQSQGPDDNSRNPIWMPMGKVIVEDGSMKYSDNFPWSTVQKQLQSMRQLLEDEERSMADSDVNPPEDEVNLSFSDVSPANFDDVTPAPVQVFKLWQVFLERVNPLIKLIHVPSLQPVVFDASTDHSKIPHNAQALLFSIYFISTVSLTEEESNTILDMPKEEALRRFASGIKTALTRASFLEKYDMMILQSLVLYLLGLHGRADRHETWILSGILIRMAQKLGLHRDGDAFDFTPFEAEMRRRLWWQIIMADTKHAMASGFHAPLLTWHWDTKLPHNVNDADLYPNFMEPIQPRDGPTEMAFMMVTCELARFVIENRITDLQTLSLGSLKQASAKDQTPKDSATPKDIVQFIETQLFSAEENNNLDPSVSPLHFLASRFKTVLASELFSLLTPLHELPEWGTEIFNSEDNVFRICLVHFERHTDLYEEIKETSFAWFFKLHFETDGILFIAGQLQTRSLGSLVDRSWALIDRVYHNHPEVWNMTRKKNVTLGVSILKAWRVREQALSQLGLPYDIPTVIAGLEATVPQSNPSPAPPVETVAPVATQQDQDWLVDQLSGYSLDPLDAASFMQAGTHPHF
ncbi:fungal-specific transcription factor domain-containing protein [Mariannaea sp. PMI_226]|nr:fungal-specific transcription factor domain-containing protein [Mariannaea sp. PMI_226]